MKILFILVILISLPTFAYDSKTDDEISDKLSPLLSNYLNGHLASFEINYASDSVGPKIVLPIAFLPQASLIGSSLQDCDENKDSLVCRVAQEIDAFLKKSRPSSGDILFTIKIYEEQKELKVIKVIKDFKVLHYIDVK